jgi:hypothetical protein
MHLIGFEYKYLISLVVLKVKEKNEINHTKFKWMLCRNKEAWPSTWLLFTDI